VKKFSSRQRLLTAAAVLLLLLFLVRPGASRLKARIAGSLAAAVGRPVEIGSVHVRLLPRPGFDLENLVVHEDPAFGAEPMLRAEKVTAALRLTSLIRGRLEIARLNLTEPSLNLVRMNGRWNLEALIERSQRTPLAPTAKTKSEPRPGFPYIECSSGRINFKIGPEKKAYALTSADFALWQDSENAWGVRLEAQPFRSDLNLSDIGVLRMNGTWQRAPSLRETPLQFSLEWDRPQLGQLTKFFTGFDQGWRGTVRADVALTGTPAKLKIVADSSVRDFRRSDIVGGDALRLAAHCDGEYSSIDRVIHEVDCRAPVGNGEVRLRGDAGSRASHNYDLQLSAESVPVSAVIVLARHAGKKFPDDTVASGTVEGALSIRGEAAPRGSLFEGRGDITNLRIASASDKAEFATASIPFVFASPKSKDRTERPKSELHNSPSLSSRSASLFFAHKERPGEIKFPDDPHVEFGPFPVALGSAKPLTAQAWASRAGYRLALSGDAEVAHALHMAELFGLPALKANAEGEAQVDVQIAGSWLSQSSVGQAAPAPVAGEIKLHSVHAELRGVDGPIEISSADLQLASNEVRVTKLSASAAHATWSGSLDLPRNCGAPNVCVVHFDLAANEADLSQISQWVNPRPRQRPWYRLLTSSAQSGPSFLASLSASGTLKLGKLQLRNVNASHVSADMALADGKLQLLDLRGDFLGGTYRGAWKADFAAKPPSYSSTGTLAEISLAQLSPALKEAPFAGTANAKYDLAATGSSAAEFWQSAEGTLQFDLREGIIAHLSLANDTAAAPLKIERLQGHAHLREGKIELKDAQLESPAGTYLVKGTASLRRELDIKLARNPAPNPANGGHGYTITGTLASPRVVASPETQANLKPQN
jgi:AsmA-like C-terminal region/AsmA family